MAQAMALEARPRGASIGSGVAAGIRGASRTVVGITHGHARRRRRIWDFLSMRPARSGPNNDEPNAAI